MILGVVGFMGLAEGDIRRIKQSYEILKAQQDDFSTYFYDCLFDFSPALQPMFKTDRKKMQDHFMLMIGFCISNINDNEKVYQTLCNLGKKHKGYGVTKEQFILVKSAFMLSLQYHLRELLDEESEQAWEKYYDNIAKIMMSVIP
jgi:hemoglobin-like flavoprotein